jgi:nucleoside phosphorylase
MNVLIVHDRAEVAAIIKEIVVENSMGDRGEIALADDYYSARKMLSERIFDLLIIDLTLPVSREKGNASYAPVNQLLDELFSMDSLNAPGDVIGITKEVETLGLIDTSIGPHLMVAIEEDAEGRWKEYLRDKLLYAQRSAQTRYISINRHFQYDALLVTAMDREMQPYSEHFEMQDIRHFPGAKEFLFSDGAGVPRKGIAFSIGRSGQPSAASFAQALITAFRPRLAIMSGYCGGVKGKVELGDLVFFEAAYAWDYGKWEEEGNPPVSVFRSRPNPIGIEGMETHTLARQYLMSDFNLTPATLKQVQQRSLGKLSSYKMYLAPAGSGSAVVSNDAIIAQIRGLNDSIWAVDMECYGFYHAAQNTRVVRPQFICVKSVSDFCNGEKGDGLHGACSYISATVVVDILRHSWKFE